MSSNSCRFTTGYTAFIFIALFLFWSNANSVQIVRVNLDYNNTTHYFDIELYDGATVTYSYVVTEGSAPNTVTNFLDYVTGTCTIDPTLCPSGTDLDSDGLPKYDDTFVYRNIPGSFIQMGAVTFRPLDPLTDALISQSGSNYPYGVVAQSPYSPVQNEFNISNTRGTVAMAKVAGDPNSATTAWFINLGDNSYLDTNNGGFTVFGKVIDDGMNIPDEISTYPIRPYAGIVLGSTFSDLPVVNYDTTNLPDVLKDNLVMISHISVINRPILRHSPENVIDFGYDIAGDSTVTPLTVTFQNTGNQALTIATINSTLTTPFSINTDNCSNISLAPGSTCTVVLGFSPSATGVYTDSLSIAYTSNDLGNTDGTYSETLNFTGEGVPTYAVLNTSVSSVTFGDTVLTSASTDTTLTIQNKGGANLTFGTIIITGTDANDFTITQDTCSGTILSMGATCTVNVSFTPISASGAGNKTATLSLPSDAPSGTIDVPLNGVATLPVISAPSSLDVTAQTGHSWSKFLTITNTGTGNLVINSATIGGADASFFSQTNSCPDTVNNGFPADTLGPGGTCRFLIKYSPTITSGTNTATLTLNTNDPVHPIVDISLNGLLGQPTISVDSNFDLGTSQINGTSYTSNLTVTNTGNTPLMITDILGLSSTSFSQTNNCIGVNVAPGLNCNIAITFTTATLGPQTATMTLNSNDPATPSASVNLTGIGDKDADGVLSSIEESSSNGGDGNNDGIADDIQNDVATLITTNSNDITLISDKSLGLKSPTFLKNVKLISPVPANTPSNTMFGNDLYSFSILLSAAGDSVELGILLPANFNSTTFYKYGPTTDNTTPHWYDFTYDPTIGTGASIIGKVKIKSPSGKFIERNFLIVRYTDGAKGDDDMKANGAILNNEIGISGHNTTGSGGSISILTLLALLIFNGLCRRLS